MSHSGTLEQLCQNPSLLERSQLMAHEKNYGLQSFLKDRGMAGGKVESISDGVSMQPKACKHSSQAK